MKTIIKIIMISFLISCTKDAKEPVDEMSSLGHDNWAKVSFIFSEGEIIEGGIFNAYKNDKNLDFKTVQKYVFISENQEVKSYNKPIKLVSGKTYGLEIKYYNNHNMLINSQFTTAEMAPIHQHFFITDPEKGTLKQTEKNTINYVYRDTNPIDKMLSDKGVVLRGENDPIGLKGYFNVLKKSPYNFDLNVILVHILGKNKLNDNGKPFPFYAPSLRIIGTRDFSQKIPVKIFTDKDSPNFIYDISKEFNISEEKAKQDIKNRVFGNVKL